MKKVGPICGLPFCGTDSTWNSQLRRKY